MSTNETHRYDGPSSLRNVEAFCDIKLCCNDKIYPASKFLLSAYSGYFRTMFISPMKESTQDIIDIDEDPTCFDKVMQWIYDQEYDAATPVWTGEARDISDNKAWVKYHKESIDEHIQVWFLADKWFMPLLCDYATNRVGTVLREQNGLEKEWDALEKRYVISNTPAAIAVAAMTSDMATRVLNQPFVTSLGLHDKVAMFLMNRTPF